jgi:hypothetical protein
MVYCFLYNLEFYIMSKSKHKPYQWIDGETADRITSLNLKDYRAYLKKELKKWKANPKTDSNPDGYWMHDEDVGINMRTIAALDLIISHFAETSDEIK